MSLSINNVPVNPTKTHVESLKTLSSREARELMVGLLQKINVPWVQEKQLRRFSLHT